MLAGAVMVPHPPVGIPEVGGSEIQKMQATEEGFQKAGAFAAAARPDVFIVLSPHAPMYRDWFNISGGQRAYGDMGQFRASSVTFDVPYDRAFIEALEEKLRADNFPAGTEYDRDKMLDHGTMVPLYFLFKALGKTIPIVRVGLSGLDLPTHYRLGQYMRQVIDASDKRYFIVASGDLSHCQKADGPYGYNEAGPAYDKRIMATMGSGNFGELFAYSPAFLEASMECGHGSFTILAGILDGTAVKPEVLSHEAPFGVGYGVVTYAVEGKDDRRHFLQQYEKKDAEAVASKEEDPYVALARQSVESWVKEHKALMVPEGLPPEMLTRKAGVFVSLHEYGELRGCIGTISAMQKNIALEIIQNGISACSRDPRFAPVEEKELAHLVISVDVLGQTEPVLDLGQLDAKKYGVIVTKDGRRGLLLPNLEGVNTPQEQIRIACRKAGIDPEEEGIELERFEVVRHG